MLRHFIAQLPVQTPTPCAQQKHYRLRTAKRERQHCECPAKLYLHKPSSSTNSELSQPYPALLSITSSKQL
ncbi:hypothetical protein AMECASPLE_034794 [Ameca splendens]|uniref:Uncharacterized protein n=2 Tax=Goodeidae TaxID=28758 RepID=A0ABV0NZE5_9TELE